jgi:WD40 repeat protein
MSVSLQPRVFISYARKDGAKLARRLQEDLTTQFDVWLDVQHLTAGDIWSREIEEAVDRADVILALLSAGSFTSDVCRIEQTRGLEKGKCVVPVLVQSDCEIPDYLQTRQWLDFSNQNMYPALLPKLVVSIQKQAGVAVSAELLARHNNAPALPENFVNRPELLEALRNTLFTEGSNRNIALTAMQGMGGIGKTVLAQALCRDEVVQQAFPDGIFWFAVGKESQLDFPSRIKSVPGLDRLLGPYDGEAACLAQYRDVLRKKAALIVADDVWRASVVQPFVAESPRSRLLITTRDTSISAWFGAREFTANLLTEDESHRVLARWCGRAVAELPPSASDVIHECGYLPLALAMIGAQLRGKPPVLWNSVLDHLRHADLQKIKAQFPEPHTTLFRAIQVSVDALDETVRLRYLALAVLLEDMAAAPQVQECIWGVDETEAAETAEQFVALSLAQRDRPEGSIRLHDLQLDFVRAQWPSDDKEALDLIAGALRLSSNVIAEDPGQFASQMVGRLLSYGNMPTIDEFLRRIAEGTRNTWLRPLQPTLGPPGTALLRILTGHTGAVNAVAVTPDGRLAVSASLDQTLKVWEVASGRELRTLQGHTGYVTGVALSEDGQRAVSASADWMLKVWEVASGRELRTLIGHDDVVHGVALSGDGRLAVSTSEDRTLKVWDVASGRELHTLKGHSYAVNGVALSGDGRLAVSASDDQTLKVWDVASGRLLRTFTGHTNWVRGVALSAEGRLAVSASSDRTLKVWEVASGRELTTLTGHTDSVYGVALSAEGRLAVSASEDKTLKVWDVANGRELRTLTAHSNWVRGVALSGDGKLAVSASYDRTMKVWDLACGRDMPNLIGHSDGVFGVASGDGRLVVSASWDRTLKVWDLASGRELRTLTGHTSPVTGVALAKDGRMAVSASADQTLKVWKLASGRAVRSLTGHTDPVRSVALSGDGKLAVSASADQTLKVWEVASGRDLCTLAGHKGPVFGVALSGDGKLAVSASADQTLKVWEVVGGRELRNLTGHHGAVFGVALSGDGKLAVSASADQTLKVWNVAGGRELCTLAGHTERVFGVALSADGTLAVSASADQTLRVWEVMPGRAVATFTCGGVPFCCAFGDGNKLIVAGDAGGRLHFLCLEAPKPKPKL